MKVRKIFAMASLALLIGLLAGIPAQRAARAQCGPAGGPCDPGGGEREKEKRPTATDTFRPTATSTGTPTATASPLPVPQSGGEGGTLMPLETPTATIESWVATADMCDELVLLTPPALRTPPAAGPPFPQCWPTRTPTQVTSIFIPPVAGPIFVRPGVKNVLIMVLLIGVLSVGGVLIARPGKKK